MTSERRRLEDRRAMVTRDLEELTTQVDDGEIDHEVADQLRAEYRAELETLDASLAKLPADKPEPARRPAPQPAPRPVREPKRRSTRRVVAGSAIVIGAITAAIFFAATGAEPDGPASVNGPGDLTVDPASVSNEQLEAVVAANPDITAMRMALADRYFEAEEYGAALDHYLFIAENSVDPSEQSVALARVGWMAYITDQPEAATEYIVRSLASDPTNSEAILFRGFITLYGLEDTEAAIPQLEAALELSNLSENVIAQVNQALDDARGGGP